MEHQRAISILVLLIAVASGIAAAAGIFSGGGPGPFELETVRGTTVTIHGQGLYRHMSWDVAVQGIGQDVVTLFIAVPALLAALVFARRGSVRARLLLAGVLGYFHVTYLFYLVMGAYNPLFLVYAALAGMSFFGLALSLLGFDLVRLPKAYQPTAPTRLAGGFLIFNTVAIALMWLGVVVPPLLDGSIYPAEVQHYTTLIVQGLDLGLLLPLCMVTAILLLRGRPMGYLLAPVYLVFLSFLMTALVAKIIGMGLVGAEIVPAVFVIPTILIVTIGTTVALFRKIA